MKETYKNYFAPETAAARYAKGRPRFHAFVIERVKNSLALEKPLALALDVGCGTGLSSVALKNIAGKVVGVDVSAAMLKQAETTRGVEYLQASAENLPFAEEKFDLVTISQAVHWVDKQKFFAEAGRVLKRDSPIIAYDNYFQGQMIENPGFNDWYKNEFLKKYPVPPRGERAFAATSERATDFVLSREELNENALEFSLDELVDYLVTVTNVIARVENGTEPVAEAYEWLRAGMKPFFGEDRKRFAFINPIWFLRRNA